MILYHGTDYRFQTFNTDMIFFFDSAEPTKNFGENTYVCNVKMNNPLEVNLDGQSWGGFTLKDLSEWNEILNYVIQLNGGNPDDEDDNETSYFMEYGITLEYISEWAMSKGYDSVIAYNVYDDDFNLYQHQYISMDSNNVQILFQLNRREKEIENK